MKRFVLLFIMTAFIFFGCGNNKLSSQETSLFAMDTYMNMKIYSDKNNDALECAENEIKKLDSLFSVTSEESDIYRINNSFGKPVPVSGDTVSILNYAKLMRIESNNALDISVYPVLCAWGFTQSEYRIPSPDEINELLRYTDGSRLDVNGNSVSIPEKYKIDVGSLAKGYSGDRIIDIFKENGVKSAIINLGGNVQTLGMKPDGSLWNVAVTNPFSTDSILCEVKVSDKAVITSGDYERYFIGNDGKKYFHIIDTATGYPAENGFVSVTVIGESGVRCDALSTALFIEGTEKAVQHWKSVHDFDMICVTDDRRILVTDGIFDKFENKSAMEVEVIYYE